MSLGIRPVTFEICGIDVPAEELAPLNTPEQIEIRRLAALQLTAPEIYFQIFPKSKERLEAEQSAANMILHPKSKAQKQAGQTAEQNATDEKAMAALADIKGSTLAKPTPLTPGTLDPNVQP